MKKTIYSFGVLLAIACCTLAYAITGTGHSVLSRSDGSANAMLTDSKPGHGASSAKSKKNLQIDEASLMRALAKVPDSAAKRKAPAARSANEHVIDYWGDGSEIVALNDGVIDAATNTISFPGSQEQTNQIFSKVDTWGDYKWMAANNATYVFSGVLSSDGYADVAACIIYKSTDGKLFIRNSYNVNLTEDNGYISNFEVSCDVEDGRPVMVGFLIVNSSSAVTITSTENSFTGTYIADEAHEWSEENNIPGLGLDNSGLYEWGRYVLPCSDGVTTLGIYYDGSDRIFVTGINTTAEQLELPQNVIVNGDVCKIAYLGYNDNLDWSEAESLKSLSVSAVEEIRTSFNGSALTDLYIGSNNCGFLSYGNSNRNIYLHIPYGENRSNYSYYGFKRVLVGDEDPSYPETTKSDYVIAGENEGEYFGIYYTGDYFAVSEIFSQNESVTLPNVTPYTRGMYYIRYAGKDNNKGSGQLCKNAPNLRSLTIPDTYTNIDISWSYNPITELHMQGNVPSTNWSVPASMTVYVGSQAAYAAYKGDSSWKNATISPDGWEFEWLTVNVGRKGEFVQTYIEMTDADWSVGTYVKVTGKLNATDMGNIRNLTNLVKLDLSECTFDGYPSTFLSSMSYLEEVTFPDVVNYLPDNAFKYSSKLRRVVMPSLEIIGNNAFNGCQNLTDLNIENVKQIGSSAFYDCRLFNPEKFSSELFNIGSSAFYNTAIEEAVIPDGTTIINSYVFDNCEELKTVILPTSVSSIGDCAFRNCSSLSSIEINEGLTQIGSRAFDGCSSIEEMMLPSTLQVLGSHSLDKCSSLKTLKSKAIVPPVANGSFVYGVDLNHCSLYVAPFVIDAYRATQYWKDFYIMKALDEPVKDIYVNRPMTFDLLSEDNAVLQENPNMTLDYNGYNTGNVGQLSATGDGTLSAGIFSINHKIQRRSQGTWGDIRTTLVNDAENMRADSVVCLMNLEKNYWHFVSFQYDVCMEDIKGLYDTDFVVRQYNGASRAEGNEGSNWEDVSADGVLKAGKGYIIQAANYTKDPNNNVNDAWVQFPSRNTTSKNNLFTSNNVIVPLEEFPAEFAHNRSWNLVGNPYSCYYDMQSLMDDFYTPIVLWRGTSYQAYSPIDDNIILRPNEAFFVQRPLDAEQIVFGADGRMHYKEAYNSSSLTPGAFKAPASAVASLDRAVFNFNIDGNGVDDRTRIVMNENAKAEYETNCDAPKFFAEAAVDGVEIYVEGDVRYDICERPFGDGTARLGLRAAKDGEYTISLAGSNIEGWTVTLNDTLTGTVVNIRDCAYTFEVAEGENSGRFLLIFKSPVVSSVEDIEIACGDEDVRIINTAGIVVFDGRLNAFKREAACGVYIVVAGENTYKMVIN